MADRRGRGVVFDDSPVSSARSTLGDLAPRTWPHRRSPVRLIARRYYRASNKPGAEFARRHRPRFQARTRRCRPGNAGARACSWDCRATGGLDGFSACSPSRRARRSPTAAMSASVFEVHGAVRLRSASDSKSHDLILTTKLASSVTLLRRAAAGSPMSAGSGCR